MRYGPIITLNNYIPLVKFDLSKNPTEEEVRKAAVSLSVVTGMGATYTRVEVVLMAADTFTMVVRATLTHEEEKARTNHRKS